MKRKLLDVYVCPLSHARLQPRGDGGTGEISKGELVVLMRPTELVAIATADEKVA